MGINIPFPMDNVVRPGLFAVQHTVGQKVWFFLKGTFIEGKVIAYWGQITPYDEEVSEDKPSGAAVSDISYAVQFYVPAQDGNLVQQVQLLEGKELFSTFDEVLEGVRKNHTLEYPQFFD